MAKQPWATRGRANKPASITAIESRTESAAALALFKRKFAKGAETIASGANEILWQPAIETWALFGETVGKNSETRPWNAFGNELTAFRQNIVVEINQPRVGIDTNLQSVFATDADGKRWVLHQGRMSVTGSRIKQADFIAATALDPVMVRFSDGTEQPYHPVACLDLTASDVQAAVGEFVRTCALVRLNATAPAKVAKALIGARKLEASLTPEKRGTYETAPRGSTIARRRHAEIWQALSKLLDARKIEHSNARVLRFGPDLFTVEKPYVLFEIKSRVDPRDVFEGLGQLAIYEQLLGLAFRKVLLVPEGMGKGLREPLAALKIDHLEFKRVGKKVVIDERRLARVLKA